MRKVFTKRPFPHLPSPNPSFEARLAQKPPFLGPISSALHWSISLPPWGGGGHSILPESVLEHTPSVCLFSPLGCEHRKGDTVARSCLFFMD